MSGADSGRSPVDYLAMLNGYQQTCILLAAFRLGIFAALGEGPKSSSDLASHCGAQPATLERLVRALVGMGWLKRDGQLLAVPAQVRPIVNLWGDAAVLIDTQYLRAWHGLAESVLTGEPGFDRAFGTTAWKHREENPEISHAFNSFGRRLRGDQAVLRAYDFSRFATIADIGGGHGELLSRILAQHGVARAMLFDQPHVLEQSKQWMNAAGVSARCTFHGGSFFDSVPAGADLYVLQHVLHDWNDQQCVTILDNCRKAMAPGATLLIIERVMPEEDPPLNLILLDLHMMTVLGGQERTLREYDKLLSAAELSVHSFTASSGIAPDLIECSL